MRNEEQILSDYIDRLSKEGIPEEDGSASPEMKRLFKTAGMIRSLREPEMPEEGYAGRLSQAVAEQLEAPKPAAVPPIKVRARGRRWFVSLLAAACGLMALSVIAFFQPLLHGNIAYAMEKAFEDVKAYHGILTVVETNAAGESAVQAELEVWADEQGQYYEKVISGAQQGLVTVNNGEQKWQLRPAEAQAVLFPAEPDAYRFTFDLGKEIEMVKGAVSIETVGEETISGRKTTVLEVTPQGGDSYRIWVDQETRLPLQKRSAMQNAVQYTVTYSEIEFEDAIPAELLAFSLPEGYERIDTSPEQEVASLEEAGSLAGFLPKAPAALPEGYAAAGIRVELNTNTVKFRYVSAEGETTVFVLENKATGELNPASSAVLGKVGGGAAEIQSPVGDAAGILGGGPYAGFTGYSSIRWQQEGYEYAVVGSAPLDEIKAFAEALSGQTVEIPAAGTEAEHQPQVAVPVDREIEEADQKNVDRGSSPWKLDPVFVAQVFVSLQISPEGIVGDYPIAYEDFSVEENTGTEAVVAVAGEETPVRRVYLERLVRQDSTGIWTVVGYDPAE